MCRSDTAGMAFQDVILYFFVLAARAVYPLHTFRRLNTGMDADRFHLRTQKRKEKHGHFFPLPCPLPFPLLFALPLPCGLTTGRSYMLALRGVVALPPLTMLKS